MILEELDKRPNRRPIRLPLGKLRHSLRFTSIELRTEFPFGGHEWEVTGFEESLTRDSRDPYVPPSAEVMTTSKDGATVLVDIVGAVLPNRSYWLSLKAKHMSRTRQARELNYIVLLTTK